MNPQTAHSIGTTQLHGKFEIGSCTPALDSQVMAIFAKALIQNGLLCLSLHELFDVTIKEELIQWRRCLLFRQVHSGNFRRHELDELFITEKSFHELQSFCPAFCGRSIITRTTNDDATPKGGFLLVSIAKNGRFLGTWHPALHPVTEPSIFQTRTALFSFQHFLDGVGETISAWSGFANACFKGERRCKSVHTDGGNISDGLLLSFLLQGRGTSLAVA